MIVFTEALSAGVGLVKKRPNFTCQIDTKRFRSNAEERGF
jgi:hypothetical protein